MHGDSKRMAECPACGRHGGMRFAGLEWVNPLLLAVLIRIVIPRTFLILAGALSCLRCLDTLLLARLQIECVALDVLYNVLLQDFALEALECALQAFAVI